MGPSWSWVSFDGKINSGQDYRAVTRVLDYNACLTTTNPFGEVRDCWIELETPIIPICLVKGTVAGEEVDEQLRLSIDMNTSYRYNFIRFDYAWRSEEQARTYYKRVPISALILQRRDFSGNSWFPALVVEAMPREMSKMPRVAALFLSISEELANSFEDSARFATVILQ